jgi:adenylyltransferase/sulfurtransferase
MNRYDRQIRLEEVGILGQKKIMAARVLCIGAGGLGSPVLYYLASAGVGTIGIVDGDKVDLTNLQRQILFTESDQGLEKALAAKNKLEKINGQIIVNATTDYLAEANAEFLFADYDLIIDGTDSFSTKFLINKTAKKMKKPWIYASVTGFEGQVALFEPSGSCLQCLLPKAPRQNQFSCAEAGVLGAMVGWVGSIQALEAIRYILSNENLQKNSAQSSMSMSISNSSIEPALTSRLLYIDGLNYSQKILQVPTHSDCPICNGVTETNQTLTPSLILTEDSEVLAETKSTLGSFSGSYPSDGLSESEHSLVKIDLEDYLVIDLSETQTDIEIRADFKYSISELFSQNSLPSTWQETSKPLLFFCESGYKSLSALSYLHALGYKNANHLSGGLTQWQKIDNTSLAKKIPNQPINQ